MNVIVNANTTALQSIIGGKSATVNGGVLGVIDIAQDLTITGGIVAQTGTIGGNLTISGGGALQGSPATNVTGTVILGNDAGEVSFNQADGLVTVRGGTLLLKNANNGISFAAGATANTTVFVAENGNVFNVDNTPGNASRGRLNFQGVGNVSNIGANNSLSEVIIGNGAVEIQGNIVQASTISLADDEAILNLFNGAMVVTGDIDFTGFTGTLNVGNGVQIDGNINNNDPDNNKGTVNFQGNAIVTGFITGNLIGDNFTQLDAVNIKGAVGTTVQSQAAVYVENLAFANANGAGALQVGGSLVTNNINFGNGGILEFNGPLNNGAIVNYRLIGAIANGNNANAVLNVNTARLTAYHPTIGTVKTINITNNNFFVIDSSADDVTVLNNQAINFLGANSQLAFFNSIGNAVRNVLLAGDLMAFGGDGGTLAFDGGTNGLNVGSSVANTARNIGDAGGDKFSLLTIFNNVTITKDINLAGINGLVISNQAVLTDNSNSSVGIQNIEIRGTGSYVIDANGGDVNVPIANIQFANENAQLVLQNSSATNDHTITLDADTNNGDDEGVVVLNSVTAGKKLTIAGNRTLGGGGNTLNAIRFQGAGDFDTTGTVFNTTNIELNNTGKLELGATTANVILLYNGVQLTQTGNIGGNLDFNGQNGTVTLNDTVNITGNVQNTGGNSNGTLIVQGASNLSSVNGIAMLKVGAGAVAIANGGDVNIGEIQGTGTNTLTLPANFKLTGGINKTGGQALKLNFTNGGSVSDVVGTAANSVGSITTAGAMSFASSVNATGTATFGGNTSFADTFTNTGPVVLANGSTYNFAKDVTATSIKADGATMNFSNSLAFNSSITGSGTTITLGANQVTYTGQGSFTDTLTLNTIFDGATNTGGNILIKSGSTLDLSKVSNLALVITATNLDINNIDEDAEYTVIFAETEGGLKPAPVGNVNATINGEQNRFLKLTFDASSLTLLAENIAEEVIEEDFAPGGPLANIPNAPAIKKSLELMAAAPSGSDARLAFNNWTNLTPIQEADALAHLIQDVVKPSDTIAAISNQIIASNISSSLINLNARMDELQPAAVAAGDEDRDAKFGAWISPFVGNATQKMRNNISGYKSDTTGGTIGFDGLVCDDLALGLAYTRADTDIKLKNNKKGDKNKVESNIYSLYGLYNLPYENFFVEGIASYSDNKIKSKARRVISTGVATTAYQTANGKYKSESYTGQLMAGYTYVMPENINLTPLAGLRYSTTKDKGYKETGTTHQNLIVKGKNYNSFDGLLGAKLSSNLNVGEVVLTPELYAMVDYAFKNKVPAIDARLQGMTAPFPTNSFKQNKTSFDVLLSTI